MVLYRRREGEKVITKMVAEWAQQQKVNYYDKPSIF